MSWFLNPRSIALVGATERSLWSTILVTNFRNCGYTGEVHLVHPRNAEAFGQRCFPSLQAIPGEVDHAYVMTGTAAALDVIEDCGRKGIRNVTMLTAGFRESGPDGAAWRKSWSAAAGDWAFASRGQTVWVSSTTTIESRHTR